MEIARKLNVLKHAILSGILVGFGVVVNIKANNTYAGAMLFSIALLVIIHCVLPLYTGRIGGLIDYINEGEWTDLLIMLVGNLIGVVLPVLLAINDDLLVQMTEIATTKFSRGYLDMFNLGILCGALMYIAVRCKNQLITVFCIMVFILSGYEHCIAGFPFLVVSLSMENILKFLMVVLGNSCGSIIVNWLFRRDENT